MLSSPMLTKRTQEAEIVCKQNHSKNETSVQKARQIKNANYEEKKPDSFAETFPGLSLSELRT